MDVYAMYLIEKRQSKIVLNSNVLNAQRLLDAPFIPNLTSILRRYIPLRYSYFTPVAIATTVYCIGDKGLNDMIMIG
jgi:hypothetical protein